MPHVNGRGAYSIAGEHTRNSSAISIRKHHVLIDEDVEQVAWPNFQGGLYIQVLADRLLSNASERLCKIVSGGVRGGQLISIG